MAQSLFESPTFVQIFLIPSHSDTLKIIIKVNLPGYTFKTINATKIV